MKLNKLAAMMFAAPLMAVMSSASADTISYSINLSNDLPDGIDYAQVTISDSMVIAGDIDFYVEIVGDAFVVNGSNFGMQTFLFNVADSISLDSSNITNLSEPWRVTASRNAGGGFGNFDVQLHGKGNSRTTELSFTISGIDGDDVYSYAVMNADGSGEYFSTHIAGFDQVGNVTSAKFAGSSVVPVPAAAWLFASGLLGLAGVARRKS